MILDRPLSQVVELFGRDKDESLTFTCFMTATMQDMRSELQWLSCRRNSSSREHGFSFGRKPITLDTKDCFELSLSPYELKHLKSYRKCHSSKRNYCLQCYPEGKGNIHQVEDHHGRMCTITKSAGLHRCDHTNHLSQFPRPWSARELFADAGIPHSPCPTCSDARSRRR